MISTSANTELRHRLRERKTRWELLQASWIDALGLFVPLAAPLVPAFLTGAAIYTYYPTLLELDWRAVLVMAFIAGFVIELLGIISIETMFDMLSFKQTAKDGEELAPFKYAAVAVVFYLLLVISLVLLLKIWHNLALWSLAPLTVLGFITAWVMVLRKQHNARAYRREVEQSSGSESGTTEQAELMRAEHEQRIAKMNSEHAQQLQINLSDHVQSLEQLNAEHGRTIEQLTALHVEQLKQQAHVHELALLELAHQLDLVRNEQQAQERQIDLLTSENERLAKQVAHGLSERSAQPVRKGSKRSTGKKKRSVSLNSPKATKKRCFLNSLLLILALQCVMQRPTSGVQQPALVRMLIG